MSIVEELRAAKWNCQGELDKSGYTSQGPRAAFRAGYSDKFYGAAKWAGNDRDFWPTAYNAGWLAASSAIAAAESSPPVEAGQ